MAKMSSSERCLWEDLLAYMLAHQSMPPGRIPAAAAGLCVVLNEAFWRGHISSTTYDSASRRIDRALTDRVYLAPPFQWKPRVEFIRSLLRKDG